MRKERKKQLLIGLLGCLLAAPGCVSIQHESEFGPNDFAPLQSHLNCVHCIPQGSQTVGCNSSYSETDLHHPTDMPVHGMQPLLSLRYAATGIKNGAGRVGSSVVGFKDKVHAHCSDWHSKRKQKSNPPPWPKFHPLPAKPAFEAATGDIANTPGTFGSFGPAANE
jgi:hypothetical protein